MSVRNFVTREQENGGAWIGVKVHEDQPIVTVTVFDGGKERLEIEMPAVNFLSLTDSFVAATKALVEIWQEKKDLQSE